MRVRIEARTPVRIDLAGGTLDIWPLYLFIKKPTTINFAIDLYASAVIEESSDPLKPKGTVFFEALDQGVAWTLPVSEIESATPPPALDLHARIFKYFLGSKPKPIRGCLRIATRAESPAGAGLGGSSSLNVALTGALHAWATGQTEVDVATLGPELIEVSRDIETQVIQVPAGLQDYYAAMYGGVQAIDWKIGAHQAHKFPISLLREIEDRVLLFYSGQSRNSGINNWKLFKKVIDREEGVLDRFTEIARSAGLLREAFQRLSWSDACSAIAAEWTTRRSLADAISTPEMDHASDYAREFGVQAFKVCGAGGGGCFFLLLPEPDPVLKSRLIEGIARDSVRHLPYRASATGLQVSVTNG